MRIYTYINEAPGFGAWIHVEKLMEKSLESCRLGTTVVHIKITGKGQWSWSANSFLCIK